MADKNPIDIQRVIEQGAKVTSLSDLQQKGFKNVKVLDERAIQNLISQAIDRVVSTQTSEEKQRVLADSRKELDRLLKEQRESKSRAQLLETDKNELVEQLEALQKELSLTLDLQQETIRKKVQESTAPLHQQTDEARRRYQAAQQELSTLRAEVDLLKADQERLLKEAQEDRESNDGVAQSAALDRKKVEALQQANADLEGRLKNAEAELAKIHPDLEKRDQELARAKEEVRKKDADLASIKLDPAKIEEKVRASIQWQVKEAQDKLETALKQSKDAVADHGRMNAQNIRLMGEAQNLRTQLATFKEELAKAKEAEAAALTAAEALGGDLGKWKFAIIRQPADKTDIDLKGHGAWQLMTLVREPDGSSISFYKAPK